MLVKGFLNVQSVWIVLCIFYELYQLYTRCVRLFKEWNVKDHVEIIVRMRFVGEEEIKFKLLLKKFWFTFWFQWEFRKPNFISLKSECNWMSIQVANTPFNKFNILTILYLFNFCKPKEKKETPFCGINYTRAINLNKTLFKSSHY